MQHFDCSLGVDLQSIMKKLFFTTSILFATLFCYAGGNLKTSSLKGTITDISGEPLAGVKIHIPSLQKDVYTDFDGNFSIDEVPIKSQSIELSYISFEQKEVILKPEHFNSSVHLELRSK